MLDPSATEPNALVHLVHAGALVLVAGMITLGVGPVHGRTRTTAGEEFTLSR